MNCGSSFLLLLRAVDVVECIVYDGRQSVRTVIFYFCVYVHRNLAILVPRQILYSFRIHPGIDEVCDVRMSQLMRRDLKVKTIHHISVMSSFLAQNRCNCRKVRPENLLQIVPPVVPEVVP